MLRSRYRWDYLSPDAATVSAIAAGLGILPPVARAMVNRGIGSVDSAKLYIAPSPASLHDPFLFHDMRVAVDRTLRAIDAGERILVLGDYDVDGISGTAVLVSFLRDLGARVSYYIPEREKEGYGLNETVVRKCHKAGYTLIITVDSGVSAIKEAALAAELGMDMIITDHHEPPSELPRAFALLNPKRADSVYPFRDLAGVGVAFKFAVALGAAKGIPQDALLEKFAELVALGTIADLVALLDENRSLVSLGLAKMAETSNIGLKHLINVSRYNEDDQLDTYLVSFGLAPRINAAGRIWNARAGVELLLADSAERADLIARKLDHHNRSRIREEGLILDDADSMLKNSDVLHKDKAIVLFSENWNVGIIGIVASKLIERHYRPVVLITLSHRPDDVNNPHPEKGRVCQGSVRSIREVDIHDALTKCSGMLLSFGGHAMAAGIKIYEKDIPRLRDCLNAELTSITPDGRFHPSIRIDDVLKLEDANLNLLQQCRQMEPCGVGNAKPVFAAEGLTVIEARTCGADGKHLMLRLGENHSIASAIGFNLTDRFRPDTFAGGSVDAAFTLREDNFRGKRSVKLQLLDMKSSQK